MNKVLLALLSVIAVAALAFGIIEMSGASDLQARIDALTADLAKTQKELAARTAQLKDLDAAREEAARLLAERDKLAAELKDLKAGSAGVAAAGAPGAKETPKSPAKGLDMAGMAKGFFKNLDDPTFRKAMKSNQETQINRVYGPMLEKLGLDEQTSKLTVDLIGERNLAALQKGRKLVEGDGATEAAMGEVRKDVEAVKTDYDTKLKSVLGDQKFQEFSSFEQTVGDQRALDSLTRGFDRGGTPLPPEQKDTLASIMREERLKTPSNEIPDLGGGPGMAMLMSDSEAAAQQKQEEDYQQRVTARASQSGFSPDQVSAMQKSFKQRNDSRVMGRAMGRMFIGGASGR